MSPDSEGLDAAVVAGVGSNLTQPSGISYSSLYIYIYIVELHWLELSRLEHYVWVELTFQSRQNVCLPVFVGAIAVRQEFSQTGSGFEDQITEITIFICFTYLGGPMFES